MALRKKWENTLHNLYDFWIILNISSLQPYICTIHQNFLVVWYESQEYFYSFFPIAILLINQAPCCLISPRCFRQAQSMLDETSHGIFEDCDASAEPTNSWPVHRDVMNTFPEQVTTTEPQYWFLPVRPLEWVTSPPYPPVFQFLKPALYYCPNYDN